jgi:hypothetical protein
MSWQPIETAPKGSGKPYEEGPAILGWDGHRMTTVGWFPTRENSGYWSLVCAGSYAEDSEWEPTHWMPLPEEPK